MTCDNSGSARVYLAPVRPSPQSTVGVGRIMAQPTVPLACRRCSAPVIGGPARKYCSDECRKRDMFDRRKAARLASGHGTPFDSDTQRRRKLGLGYSRRFTCAGCGQSQLADRSDRKYCSRECRFNEMKRNAPAKAPVLCVVCRATITGHRGKSYCSATCRRSLAKKQLYIPRPVRPATACHTCRSLIPGRSIGRSPKFCSKKCRYRSPDFQSSKRAAKAARKAITRGNDAERFDPVEIFRRDKWRCRQCRQRTPSALRGRYLPNAPELDHVVPLARGGSHTRDNVQCLCRACNGKKGAKLEGQLQLWGWSRKCPPGGTVRTQ